MKTIRLFALAALIPLACDAPADRPAATDRVPAATADAGEPAPGAVEAAFVVYKSPTCGCCNGWVEHLQGHGHQVDPVDVASYNALSARKAEAGVPADLESCHTALVDGYTIEGHVPADVIERLLRERPPVRGLAVPGMPIGSPGMEGPGAAPYEVIAFGDDGARSVYATVDPVSGVVTY